MLIKGASRDIRNDEGKRPVDVIDSSIGPVQKLDLQHILGKQPVNIPCS